MPHRQRVEVFTKLHNGAIIESMDSSPRDFTYTRACFSCGAHFKTNRKNKVYCKRTCYQRKAYEKRPDARVCTGTQGAISELLVATDLLQNGLEVFRALSPSCSADLALIDAGKLVSVEVRTAYRVGTAGKLIFAPKINADMFGLYVHGEGVMYREWTETGLEFKRRHAELKWC